MPGGFGVAVKVHRERESEFNRLTENSQTYGFQWDQVVIQRTAEIQGRKIITVATSRETLELWITPTGLIRINNRR